MSSLLLFHKVFNANTIFLLKVLLSEERRRWENVVLFKTVSLEYVISHNLHIQLNLRICDSSSPHFIIQLR